MLELAIQNRIADAWYNGVVAECRDGRLSMESYYFLMGLPTEHAGSWRSDEFGNHLLQCGSEACAQLPQKWLQMAKEGRSTWQDMQAMECVSCKEERERRNRLIAPDDPRLVGDLFREAPYVNKNNQPKYDGLGP